MLNSKSCFSITELRARCEFHEYNYEDSSRAAIHINHRQTRAVREKEWARDRDKGWHKTSSIAWKKRIYSSGLKNERNKKSVEFCGKYGTWQFETNQEKKNDDKKEMKNKKKRSKKNGCYNDENELNYHYGYFFLLCVKFAEAKNVPRPRWCWRHTTKTNKTLSKTFLAENFINSLSLGFPIPHQQKERPAKEKKILNKVYFHSEWEKMCEQER